MKNQKLGTAIIKQRFNPSTKKHTLSSITQHSSIQALLEKLSTPDSTQTHNHRTIIPPRIPFTGQQNYSASEENAFLCWKSMHEGVFEKNLHVWRQFWIACEMGDVVVQVVDGRNPWFFFNGEIVDAYEKVHLVVVNKSDLIKEKEGCMKGCEWEGCKVRGCNKGCMEECKGCDNRSDKGEGCEKYKGEECNSEEYNSEECKGEKYNSEEYNNEKYNGDEIKGCTNSYENDIKNACDTNAYNTPHTACTDPHTPHTGPHTCKEFIEHLKRKGISYVFNSSKEKSTALKDKLSEISKHLNKPFLTAAMVGYPNVGKSSLINSLMNEKKVKVSMTPGKTKHIQSLCLEHSGCTLKIVDCPGLVFPKHDTPSLVLNGVINVDQVRDLRACGESVIKGVGVDRICRFYGIRGFINDSRCSLLDNVIGSLMAAKNVDYGQCVKMVVKDYISGRIGCGYESECVDTAVRYDWYDAAPKKKSVRRRRGVRVIKGFD